MSITKLNGFTNIDSFKPVVAKEKPQELNKQTTNDNVLDLSKENIQNELLFQDISKITHVQIGNQLITGLSKEEISKLVETLKKECLEPSKDNKDGFKLKDDFKMLNFSQETGITISKSDFNFKTEDKSLAQRAKERSGLTTGEEVKDIVGADLSLINKKFTTNNDASGRILLQDMSLLESKGLLKKDELELYHDVLGKFGKDYKENHGSAVVSKENVAKLLEIAKKYATTLDTPILTVDKNQISKLGTKDGGTLSQQYEVLTKNKASVKASSESAIDDAFMAVKETGSGTGVTSGRSFTRMKQAMDELGTQFSLINDKLLPTASAQMKNLNEQIDKKVLELVKADPKYKDLTDPKEIKVAISKDSALLAKLNTDPSLMVLNAKLREASGNYEDLANQALKVGKARASALEGYKTVSTIHKEENTRIGAAQVMTTQLGLAENRLKNIQSRVDDLGIMSMEPTQKQILTDGFSEEIQDIKQNAIRDMKDLIKTYEGSSTKNPDALKLLNTQLERLNNLKTTDPKEALEELQKAKKFYMTALEKSVPAFISSKELTSLKDLDKKVSSFSDTSIKLDDGIVMTNQMIQLQMDEIKHQNDDVSKTAIKEITNLESNTPESRWGLTFGSHVGFSVDLGAGIGVGTPTTAEAKVALTLGTAATIEKSFGKGPTFCAHIDWNVKLEGNLTIADIIDVRSSIKGGSTLKALGFSNPEEMQDYFSKLGKTLKLYIDSESTSEGPEKDKLVAEYKKLKAEVSELTKKASYDASFVEDEKSISVGKDNKGAGYKDTSNTTITTLPDGTKVEDQSSKTSVKVGAYEISVNNQISSEVAKESKPTVDKHPDTRTVLNVAIPADIIKKAVEASSFAKLPKVVLDGLAEQYSKATGVKILGDKMVKMLDDALLGLKKSNPLGLARIMKVANEAPTPPSTPSPASKSVGLNVNIGLEILKTHDTDKKGQTIEKNSLALQLGIDASASYRRDFPFSVGGVPAFARVSGKAEFEAGVFYKFYRDEKTLPETK